MHLKQMFNKRAYVFNGRFNSAYMGSVLNMLRMSQHLYKREDIAKAYRFLADLVENGEFSWGGTFDLVEKPEVLKKILRSAPKTAKIAPKKGSEKPEVLKKPLRSAPKIARIVSKKDSEEPIASESIDTTPIVQSE